MNEKVLRDVLKIYRLAFERATEQAKLTLMVRSTEKLPQMTAEEIPSSNTGD